MATVLVVEDDPTIRELMVGVLAEEGYRAKIASTTPEVLPLIEADGIDLIIAELGPGPYGDGAWQRLSLLRQAAPHTPIIVCTGYGEALKVPPQERDVNAILTKPFDIDELVSQVARLCR